MPTANYAIGDTFSVQFAWNLPDGDYIRAVFQADVLDTVPEADKYIIRLVRLIAGRQENKDGELKPTDEFSRDYWALVGDLVGQKLTLAYEADNGRALHLRLATLTGEHNFFRRYSDVEEMIKKKLSSAE